MDKREGSKHVLADPSTSQPRLPPQKFHQQVEKSLSVQELESLSKTGPSVFKQRFHLVWKSGGTSEEASCYCPVRSRQPQFPVPALTILLPRPQKQKPSFVPVLDDPFPPACAMRWIL